MKNIIIIGADSDIGAALFARLSKNNTVVGTSRRQNSSQSFFLDVNQPKSWDIFKPDSYDEIIFCIGIGARGNHPLDVYKTNALHSVMCIDRAAGSIRKGGAMRILSSVAGSTSAIVEHPLTAIDITYKMSKAALNIGIATLHHKHKEIRWQLIHPGFVRTKMTAGVLDHVKGAISVLECAEYLSNLPIPKDKNIEFVNYDGSPMSW